MRMSVKLIFRFKKKEIYVIKDFLEIPENAICNIRSRRSWVFCIFLIRYAYPTMKTDVFPFGTYKLFKGVSILITVQTKDKNLKKKIKRFFKKLLHHQDFLIMHHRSKNFRGFRRAWSNIFDQISLAEAAIEVFLEKEANTASTLNNTQITLLNIVPLRKSWTQTGHQGNLRKITHAKQIKSIQIGI